jgi:hypothetical protein
MPKKKDILMAKGEITKLTRANTKSYSLRTTVPKGIANQFELKEGDKILWSIKPHQQGKDLINIIVITPNPENSKSENSKKKKVRT